MKKRHPGIKEPEGHSPADRIIAFYERFFGKKDRTGETVQDEEVSYLIHSLTLELPLLIRMMREAPTFGEGLLQKAHYLFNMAFSHNDCPAFNRL